MELQQRLGLRVGEVQQRWRPGVIWAGGRGTSAGG